MGYAASLNGKHNPIALAKGWRPDAGVGLPKLAPHDGVWGRHNGVRCRLVELDSGYLYLLYSHPDDVEEWGLEYCPKCKTWERYDTVLLPGKHDRCACSEEVE